MVRAECFIGVAALMFAATPSTACVPPSVAFDYGSSALTAEGQAEVAYLANEVSRWTKASIKLVAQNDGSAANLQMARRRARAVKEALVRQGVPASSVAIELRGPLSSIIVGKGYARRVVMLVGSAAETRADDKRGSTCG